ncbi:Retrotransposable element Tf2 protein [Ceratobasidium sp. AG-Ba]|nr:Retrotransposable element Tf2 protein [Ceratobasidium sp. AG-Ba]QRW10899.1 Retrotransposable element Tf2 protein [Ceratobasidium sp. AG-Ba]
MSLTNESQFMLMFRAQPCENPLEKRSAIQGKPFSGWAMIDSGASSVFINEKIVQDFQLFKKKLDKPRRLKVIDGREIDSGKVEHYVTINLKIFEHEEEVDAYVVNVGNHDLVLGMAWLKCHNPAIDWDKKSLVFSSPYCSKNCLHTSPIVKSGEPDLEIAATSELPSRYSEFAKIFTEEEISPLPPHRPYDCEITLKPDAVPRHGPIYSLGPKEDEELRKTVTKQLEAGLIRPSKSPMASPVIFVKKKNGSLRMCIDYRKLNEMTVKNVYPLPRSNDLIEKLRGAKIFSKFDLKWGYNLVRIKEGDEWKTAFKTRYGLFEYLVMPFGLTNAPATFQHFMNDIFRDILDVYVIIYLDDILVFSKNREDHEKHVREVLSRLQKHHLYCNLAKCFFSVEEIDYLGLIVSPEGIRVDPAKVVKAIDWSVPSKVVQVQEFVGFCNFYRTFIRDYSHIAAPLFNLTRKNHPWEWTDECATAFEHLKEALRSAPVLIIPDISKQFFLECDASDFATGAILSQFSEDNQLHPVAFLSKAMTPAERNYDIYHKELLAIVKALKEWRHLLEGTALPVQIITDHKNLEPFKATKDLRGRLARWAGFLSEFNFQLKYRPGKTNGKADILSRKDEHRPLGGGESRALLDPSLFIAAIEPDEVIDDHIRDAYLQDDRLNHIIEALQKNDKVKNWSWNNGLLIFKNKIYVPNNKSIRKEILASRHDNMAAGHPGQFRTLELVNRKYYWKSLKKSVNDYVSNCESCIRNKHSNQLPPGLLNPIELPSRPWDHINYDLITGLPESEGFDAILTVVDRMSQMVHFVPTTSRASATDVANLFVTYIWKLHGLPSKTISDRGPQFNSAFLKHLYKRLDIKPSLSTAFRPQTDGLAERLNQVVEIYLRHYVAYKQDDWVGILPMAEFAYNNSVNSSTNQTPFFACYGFHPRFSIGQQADESVPHADERADQLKARMEELQASVNLANEKIKHYYDLKHRAPDDIKVGDKVWLDARNIKTERPVAKLSAKKIGPYKVLKREGTHAFRLELPHTLRVHPVFHTSLISLKKEDPFNRDPPQPPAEVTPEGEEEYEVEKILDSRKRRNQVQYLVHWKGYGPESNTWEPMEHLNTAMGAVRKFHRENPQALRHPDLEEGVVSRAHRRRRH